MPGLQEYKQERCAYRERGGASGFLIQKRAIRKFNKQFVL